MGFEEYPCRRPTSGAARVDGGISCLETASIDPVAHPSNKGDIRGVPAADILFFYADPLDRAGVERR